MCTEAHQPCPLSINKFFFYLLPKLTGRSPLKLSNANAAGPAYYILRPQKGITISLF